jgi:hypothetical protein
MPLLLSAEEGLEMKASHPPRRHSLPRLRYDLHVPALLHLRKRELTPLNTQ